MKHAVVFLFKLSSSPDSTTATLSSTSAFIHTTTLILGTTHCCSSNKRSQSKRPYHTYTETTALASHPCPYCIQNLHPHVSHSFWNLSIIHVIHGYAMLCFQVQRTPIIHAWGFCCNLHKSEVWQSCFLGRWTYKIDQPSCFSSSMYICCPI